jgi:hypothetical protein
MGKLRLDRVRLRPARQAAGRLQGEARRARRRRQGHARDRGRVCSAGDLGQYQQGRAADSVLLAGRKESRHRHAPGRGECSLSRQSRAHYRHEHDGPKWHNALLRPGREIARHVYRAGPGAVSREALGQASQPKFQNAPDRSEWDRAQARLLGLPSVLILSLR